MLGALFFRYFELAADEEGDGSVSEQVISRADLRCDGKEASHDFSNLRDSRHPSGRPSPLSS